MAKVGELSFDFTLDTSKVGQAFTAVENRVGQLESRLAKVGGSGLALNTRDAEASVTSLDKKVGGLGDTMQRIVGVVAGFAVVRMGMQAIGNAFSFAKQSAIEFNDLQLGALKGFTSMLQSGEMAQNMLSQLKQFAAATPFEFQGLLKSSQQLMAFGVAADQVIPLLTDIGNAAAYFHAGQQGVESMTYALGQMNASVVLHTQDLMQLTNVGVPVWQILADGMNKTVPEIRKMVENGQIASSTFIDLFDQWSRAPERADQMKQANSTLEGSMSTIHDQVQFLIADGFKPFYDILVKLSNFIAAFVSTDSFSAWGARIASVVANVIDAFGAVPELFGRVKDTWELVTRAFQGQDMSAVFTSMDNAFGRFLQNVVEGFKNGGIAGAILAAMKDGLSALLSLAPDWAQAGATLVETFAQGMWDAVTGTVSAVFNAIADFIGGFFIGSSPPPMGPLSQIDEAGRVLMETYADGMQGGLDGVSSVADSVNEMLTSIDTKGIMDGFIAGAQQGAFSMDQLKDASSSVDDAIQAIDGSLEQVNIHADDLNLQISDINDAYNAQIDPLQKAVDLLGKQVDYARTMNDLQLQLADVNVRQAMHDDTHLTSLNAQKKAAEDAVKGIKTTTDPATSQRLADLNHQLASIPNDKAHAANRAALQKQIEGLKYETTTTQNLSKEQKDAAQANLDNINQQIDAIKSGYQAKQDDIKFQRDGIALADERAGIEAKITALPMQQSIDDLKKKRDAEIAPLQSQLDILDRQKKHLEGQKQLWTDIGKLVKDALKPMEDAQKAAEAAAKKDAAAAKAGSAGAKKAALPELPTGLNIPHQSLMPDHDTIVKSMESATDAAAQSVSVRMQQKAKEIGTKLLTTLSTYLKNNWGRVFGSFLGGAIGSTFGPLGTLAGSALGSHLGAELQKRLKTVDWVKVKQTVQGALGNAVETVEGVAKRVSDAWKQYGPTIMDNLRTVKDDFLTMAKSIKDGIDRAMPSIQSDLLPALGTLAYIVGFVVLPAVMNFVGWFSLNVLPLLITFGSIVLANVVDGLVKLALWFGNNETALNILKVALETILGIMVANKVYDFAKAMQAAAVATGNWGREALRAPKAITQTISQTFTKTGQALSVAGDVTRTITEKLALVGEDLAIRAMLLTDKVVNITENLISKGADAFSSIKGGAVDLLQNVKVAGLDTAQAAVDALQGALDGLAKTYQVNIDIMANESVGGPSGGAGGGVGGGSLGDQIGGSIAAQIAKSLPQFVGSAIGSAIIAGIGLVSLPVAAVAGLVLALVGLITLYIMRPDIPGTIAGAWAGILTEALIGVPLLMADIVVILGQALVGIWIDAIKFVGSEVGTIAELMGGILSDAFHTAIGIAKIVFVQMPSEIIGALASHLGPDIANFFRSIISGDWSGAIHSALEIVLDLFVRWPADILRILGTGFGQIFGLVGGFVGDVGTRFGTFFTDTVTNLTTFGGNLLRTAQTALGNVVGAFTAFGGNVLSVFGTSLGDLWTKAKEILGDIATWVGTWLQTFWQSFKDKFDALTQPVQDGLNSAKNEISTLLNALHDDVIEPLWTKVQKLFTDSKQTILDAIKWPFDEAGKVLGPIVDKVKGAIATPFNAVANGINEFISGFANAINWVAGKLQLKFTIDTKDITKIPTFATGGVTPGGPIIVGEKGPELMFPDAGKRIVPHDESMGLLGGALPAFWGGPGDIAKGLWNGVGKVTGAVGRAVSDFIKKGVEAIVKEAMDVAGIGGGLLGDANELFKEMGGSVFDHLKAGLVDFVKGLIDNSKGHLGGSTGSWIFPVPGGSPGQGSFGSYSHSQIAAVDIGAARGSTIVAPDGGSIMFDGQNGWSGGTGHTMMMQHDNDWVTLYGHVSAVLGKIDDVFEQGQPVARVGDPAIDGGIGSGAHLHFEMWHNHARVRPEDYIPGWGGGKTNAYYMGGVLTEPVDGYGRWSKQPYSFAERGIERVSQGGGGGGSDTHVHGDVNITVATQPGQNEQSIATAIHEIFVTDVRRAGYTGA